LSPLRDGRMTRTRAAASGRRALSCSTGPCRRRFRCAVSGEVIWGLGGSFRKHAGLLCGRDPVTGIIRESKEEDDERERIDCLVEWKKP
jgi:hypothetical protein